MHDLSNDPTESFDVSADYPRKIETYEKPVGEAAWDNQVFPLDEGNNVKNILRPPWNHELVQDMVLYPGTPTVERWKSQQLISFGVGALRHQLISKMVTRHNLRSWRPRRWIRPSSC